MSSFSFYRPSNTYAVGNLVNLRFCFTIRTLTDQEVAVFLSGGGLPNGVGIDQPVVRCDYYINEGPVVTVSGTDILHDATGAYRAVITADTVGVYYYRGYSVDSNGNPLASTELNKFTIVDFR